MSDDDRVAQARAGERTPEPALERTPADRRADHAAIDRLADELLPALVAKLGASGLGELDVREGAWRVRLRMPGDARGVRRPGGGRVTGRPELHQPASHAPAAAAASTPPATEPARESVGPTEPPTGDAPTRAMATSPAVGFFRPRPDLAAGARVRAGDRLGMVDVLGVPQEVVAPADGLVGASFVEPGDPVEYGQAVVEIEILATSTPGPAPASPASRADAEAR